MLASCSWSVSTSLSLEGTVAPCGINTEPNLGFINPTVPGQSDKGSYALCHSLLAVLLSLTIVLEGSQLMLFEVYRTADILCFLLGRLSEFSFALLPLG